MSLFSRKREDALDWAQNQPLPRVDPTEDGYRFAAVLNDGTLLVIHTEPGTQGWKRFGRCLQEVAIRMDMDLEITLSAMAEGVYGT